MRDEEVRESELGLQILQQIQDLRLDRDVERGHRLVAEHKVGLERERTGDADALALSAGKAVRVPVEEARVESDEAHQLLRHVGPIIGIADLVDHERLAQDVEHRHPRAERSERILKNVLDAPPEPHQRLRVGANDVDHRAAVVEQDLPAVGLERAHDHLGQRGLAATALADEAEALAAGDLEAHVVDRAEHGPLALAEQAAATLLERLADVAHVEVDLRRVGGPGLRLLHQFAGLVVDRSHGHESFTGLHVEVRDRMQQGAQIRMGRPLVQGVDRAPFHHPSLIENDDFLGQVGDDAEVVRDDEHGHVELGLEVLDQRQDLGLDRDVERRRRLIGDQERRPADERHRDHGPLPQAAGQLERVILQRARGVGKADEAQHFLGLGHALLAGDAMVKEEGLADLVADRVQRRQRHHRLLKDHGDVAAADPAQGNAVGLQLGDVARRLARARRGKEDLAGCDVRGLGQNAHYRLRRHGFAGAGLTDQRDGGTGTNAERNPIQRRHHRAAIVELDREILNVDQVCQTPLPQAARHSRPRGGTQTRSACNPTPTGCPYSAAPSSPLGHLPAAGMPAPDASSP